MSLEELSPGGKEDGLTTFLKLSNLNLRLIYENEN